MEEPGPISEGQSAETAEEKKRFPAGRRLARALAVRLAKLSLIREALAQKVDLGALRAKPTPRVRAGLGIIAVSYVIGWPAVGFLAWVAFHLGEPLVIVVGGPATYGLSHLAFLGGSYLAGERYARILLGWAARRLVERLAGGALPDPAPDGPETGAAAPRPGVPLPDRSKAAPSLALVTGSAAFAASLLLLFVWPPLAALPPGLFVLLCLVAPFWPGSRFFLPVVHRQKTDRRAVCLTFDDGPDPDVTPRLLELLARRGVPATFFVTGVGAEQNPGLIRELLLKGHSLGNHSYHHDVLLMLRSRTRLREEIARTQELLAAFGVRPLTFRPPVGITSPRLAGVVEELGLTCVLFSCRARDMGNRRIARLADRILKKVRPGDIILLHDVRPRGAGTIGEWLAETEQIICGLEERGYEVLPLPELIGRPVMETPAEGRPARRPPQPGEGGDPGGWTATTPDSDPDGQKGAGCPGGETCTGRLLR